MRRLYRLLLLICTVMLITISCQAERSARNDIRLEAESEQPEQVTITLLQFKAEIADQIIAMTEDYMAEHPHVIIEAQILKDYDTTLITRFAAGEAPDIFTVKSYTGIQDWSQRIVDLSDEPWMDKVSPAAIPGMTVNGQRMGFPMSFEGYGFIYNKDHFRAAGIASVPETVSELWQANELLQSAGIPSFSEGYKEWWILGQHLFNLPFAYEEDPVLISDKLSAGELTMQDLNYMDGFFDVLDMTVLYGPGAKSIGISYDDQVSEFASGKTAMMQQGVWTIEAIRRINPELNIGMFAIPLSENPEETRMPIGVPGYYVINRNSEHLEESKQFLRWLHENGQKYLVDSFQFIPAFTDLQTTSDLGPLAADLIHYVENDQTIPWVHAMWSSGMHQEFSNVLQVYVGGGLSREEAIAQLQTIWEESMPVHD